MTIVDLVNKGRFVVTAEIGPPKGVDTAEFLSCVELLKDKVDAINVTDQQSSVMRLGSLACCHLLREMGIEPIFQMTCRDRNRIALQSDALNAYVLGISHILCLTGDHVLLGDHPGAKPVFDLDSVGLLDTLRRLQEGKDLGGQTLRGTPVFCTGAVVSPCTEPMEMQAIKMEKKVKAGAQFFQTQAVYEPGVFERFVGMVKHLKVPILVGIVLLRSAAMARFMNANVAGVHVPEAIIEEMESANNKLKKGIEISARLIKEMRGLCQGVHLMAIGLEKHVPAILEAAGL